MGWLSPNVVSVLGWVVHTICIYVSNRAQGRGTPCKGCGRSKEGRESFCGECDAVVEKRDMSVLEVPGKEKEKGKGCEEKERLLNVV